MSVTIKIALCTPVGQEVRVGFDPTEPTWVFCYRFGEKIPGALDLVSGTNRYGILYQGREITTFANRLRPIGELIPPETQYVQAIEWSVRAGVGFIWKGNASPLGGERSTCVLCSTEMRDIGALSLSNPLIPTTLKCGHAFHQRCLARWTQNTCPTCFSSRL